MQFDLPAIVPTNEPMNFGVLETQVDKTTNPPDGFIQFSEIIEALHVIPVAVSTDIDTFSLPPPSTSENKVAEAAIHPIALSTDPLTAENMASQGDTSINNYARIVDQDGSDEHAGKYVTEDQRLPQSSVPNPIDGIDDSAQQTPVSPEIIHTNKQQISGSAQSPSFRSPAELAFPSSRPTDPSFPRGIENTSKSIKLSEKFQADTMRTSKKNSQEIELVKTEENQIDAFRSDKTVLQKEVLKVPRTAAIDAVSSAYTKEIPKGSSPLSEFVQVTIRHNQVEAQRSLVESVPLERFISSASEAPVDLKLEVETSSTASKEISKQMSPVVNWSSSNAVIANSDTDQSAVGEIPKDLIGFWIEGASEPKSSALGSHFIQPTRPEIAAPIARQIADTIHARVTAEKVMEVSLHPAELGRLKLSITPAENGLIIHILAERAETLDLVRRNIHELENAFAELGQENISFSFGANDSFSDGEKQSDPERTNAQNKTTASLSLLPIGSQLNQEILPETTGIDIRI